MLLLFQIRGIGYLTPSVTMVIRAQQAPLWEGALKAGLQQQRGGRRDLGAVSFKYSG